MTVLSGRCDKRVRIFFAMRHAVLYVTPSCLCNSIADTPFSDFANRKIAKNHIFSGVLDLRKIVSAKGCN